MQAGDTSWNTLKQEMLAAAGEARDAAKATSNALGTAKIDPSRSTRHKAVFLVERKNTSVTEEQLQGAFLAPDPRSQPRHMVYVDVDGADFLVEAPAAAAEYGGPLKLFVETKQQSFYDAVVERIEESEEGGLACTVRDRRLRRGQDVAAPGELNQKQLRAYQDMISPGVNVVWGPPGTGKTQVIATFLAEALRSGASVLLTSHTNVAVDNALARLVRDVGQLPVGTIVRIGSTVAQEIEDHPHLTAEKAAAKLFGRDEERQALEEEKARLRLVNNGEEINRLGKELGGDFDLDRFTALGRQLDLRDAADELQRQLDELNKMAASSEQLPEPLRSNLLSPAFEQTRRELAAKIAADRSKISISPAEAAWVMFGREQDLPRKAQRLAELRQEAERTKERRDEITAKIRDLDDELKEIKSSVRNGAKLVACTLTGLAMSPHLKERTYDYVVIDEVAAAWPVHVLYAATRARKSVSLIGDFYQNGPISPVHSAEAQPLNRQTIFELLGIETSADAIARDGHGLTALEVQHRFGQGVNDLVNITTYADLLRTAPGRAAGTADPQEIWLIDVAPLGKDLAETRRPVRGSGRWWPAGAFTSLHLAQRYAAKNPEGRRLAVVTPYRCQADITAAALTEANLPYIAETSHRMQGAEYDDVVFDLVEATGRQGWMCSSDIGALRVFTVAATRTRNRLVVVADLPHLLRQGEGPLVGLRELIDHNGATVLDARSLLGDSLPKSGTITTAMADLDGRVLKALSEFLAEQAATTEFYDAAGFYRHLPELIEGAEESLRIWAPFVTNRRLGQMLPLLAETVARGVNVVVYVKPPHEVNSEWMNTHRQLADLRASGVFVEEQEGMHEKAVLIDRDDLYIGSLNLLSNNGATGEIMLRLEGRRVADVFLRFMGAQRLPDPKLALG